MQEHKDTNQTRGQLNVIYGTTSGTSSRLAFNFAREARKHQFDSRVINLGDFSHERLVSCRISVFFVSTYGSGGPTGDSEVFFKWLMEQTQQILKGISFVVFALGNSTYEEFCGMGVKVDAQLEHLGGKRVYQLGKGDAHNDFTEADCMNWQQLGIWDALKMHFPLHVGQSQQDDLGFNVQPTNEIPIELDSTPVDQTYEFNVREFLLANRLPILEIQQLRKNSSFGNSTLLITLDSTSLVQSGQTYQTAGNLIIYPENSYEDVQQLITYMGWDMNMVMKVSKSYPSPLRLRDYLTCFCDFIGTVSKYQVYELSKLVKDEQSNKQLEYLSSYEGREHFEEQITNQNHGLLTLIQKYKIQMSIQDWLRVAQPLRPRTYTISSSSKMNPNRIRIVVSALTMKTPMKERMGVCSEFLSNLQQPNNLKQSNKLRVKAIESNFKFPDDPFVPILLVGSGAGIAPMMALIEERDYYIAKDDLDSSPLQGQMFLYFGCRSEDDFLFKQEITEYEENGTIREPHVAFSRQQGKVYVTHLLANDLQFLGIHFLEMNGVMYICGSAQMGRDVLSVVGDMFKQYKKVMPYLAFKKVLELEKKKQIIKEIWG